MQTGPDNLGQFRDEQGEHFRQEKVTMEKRFELMMLN